MRDGPKERLCRWLDTVLNRYAARLRLSNNKIFTTRNKNKGSAFQFCGWAFLIFFFTSVTDGARLGRVKEYLHKAGGQSHRGSQEHQ